MFVRIGYVVETHPEDHSVDLVMADDGSRVVGAQVQTADASARSGSSGLPKITPKGGDKWDITNVPDDAMKAVVSYTMNRSPIVTGFLHPQINQMTPKKGDFGFRRRWPSDVEATVSDSGDVQVTHPNGTYMRIGESTEKAVPQVADKTATDRNTGRAVSVHVGLAGGVLHLTLKPDGSVELVGAKGALLQFGEASTIRAPALILDADVSVAGDLAVAGDTELHGVTSRGVDVSSTHRHQFSSGPGPGGVPVGG